MELLHPTGIEQVILHAIEHLPGSVLFFGKDGHIDYANARGRELLRANGNPGDLREVVGSEADEIMSKFASGSIAPAQFITVLKEQETGERVYINLTAAPEGIIAFSGNVTERDRQEAEIRKRNSQLSALSYISATASSTLDLSEVLARSIEKTCEVTGIPIGCIFLLQDDTLMPLSYSGICEEYIKQAGTLNVGDCAEGRAVKYRTPEVIHDLREYGQKQCNLHLHTDIRSLVAVPIIIRDEVIGVLDLATRDTRMFTREEIGFYQSIANTIGSAINNARYVRQIDQQKDELALAKDELEDSYERLKSLDRMKMEFFTLISHELRTPLTTIKGYTELLKDGMLGPVNDEQRDRLSRIDASVDRLTGIVENLGDLSGIASKKYAGKKIPVSLNELIDEVVRGVTFLADDKGISIKTDVPWKLPIVNVDKSRVQQVLLNIVNNAIKYTPDGGKICITARDEGGYLLVAIKDTGIGIPRKDLENIFSGFYHAGYKLSYEYKGVGLGLAISKRIVEDHGGRIWAESEPGKGSILYFTLPKEAA